MQTIRRYPLPAFFTLAYALSWSCWGLDIALGGSARWLIALGAFGPSLAALLVTGATGGRVGVRALLGRLRRWRLGGRMYALALGGPALLAFGAALLDMSAGGPALSFARQVPAGHPIYVVIPVLVPIFLYGLISGGPLGEELGWRGFALPALLARLPPLAASAILGVVWGIWHAPLFLIAGTSQAALPLGAFVAYTTGLSYLFTRLHVAGGGSVPLAIIFHAASNLSVGLLVMPTAGFPSVRPFFFHLGLLWLVCAVLAATARTSRRSRGVAFPRGGGDTPAAGGSATTRRRPGRTAVTGMDEAASRGAGHR